MTADSGEIRDEVISRAEGYYRGMEFSNEDAEAVFDSLSEFSQIVTAEDAYFVLGSYDGDCRDRLKLVQDELRSRGGYAFIMDEVAEPWEQPYPKYRLLADLADYIVGVAEHRCGGFLVEQGYFTAVDDYFERTYILKLTYPNDGIREAEHDYPYSWMQEGVFDQLAAEGRVFMWQDESSLADCVGHLPPEE